MWITEADAAKIEAILAEEGFTNLQKMPYGYAIDYKAKRGTEDCFVDVALRGEENKSQNFRFKKIKLRKLAAANSILNVYLLFITKWDHRVYTFTDLVAQKIEDSKIVVRDNEIAGITVPIKVIAPLRPRHKDCREISDPRHLRIGEGPVVDSMMRIRMPLCVATEFKTFVAEYEFKNQWMALLYLIRNAQDPTQLRSLKRTVTTAIR